MRTIIRTIPHRNHRYETVGDYYIRNGTLHIDVSDMHNDDYAFLVGLHEEIEAKLCKKAGVSFRAITAWDKAFEARRKPGNTDEPGGDPRAPYFRQHRIATKIERLAAKALGVNWKKYNDVVESL